MISWIPNVLSFVRCVLAIVLIWAPIAYRPWLIIVSAMSDFFDGYIARRYGVISRLGTVIDPLGDKMFAASCIYIFWANHRLVFWQIACLLAREVVIILFTMWLMYSHRWGQWTIQSFWCGKWVSAGQCMIFLALSLGYSIAGYWYIAMAVCACCGFIELSRRALTSRNLGIRATKR